MVWAKLPDWKIDEKQKQDITFFDKIRNKNTCIELRLVSGITLFQVSWTTTWSKDSKGKSFKKSLGSGKPNDINRID
jgi:hypothetical protein